MRLARKGEDWSVSFLSALAGSPKQHPILVQRRHRNGGLASGREQARQRWRRSSVRPCRARRAAVAPAKSATSIGM